MDSQYYGPSCVSSCQFPMAFNSQTLLQEPMAIAPNVLVGFYPQNLEFQNDYMQGPSAALDPFRSNSSYGGFPNDRVVYFQNFPHFNPQYQADLALSNNDFQPFKYDYVCHFGEAAGYGSLNNNN